MTVEYIRYRLAGPQHRAAFEAACRRAVAGLGGAGECVDYALERSAGDPDGYRLRIRWTSDEGRRAFWEGREGEALVEAVAPYAEPAGMSVEEATPVAGRGGSTPTLYAWAGGAPALERLFTRFYERVDEDALLAPVFAGKDPAHAQHVAAWLGEVFGGPPRYSTEHGGHRRMASRHLGRGITEEQRRRWIALLTDTADEVGLPDDPEFRAVLAHYLEWGTRMAVLYSGPNPPPLPEAPVPHWDWGITPPYRG
ncbi:group II truncated hemoglobin [Streptomyces sp. NRRL B-24484]|uniref:group II truncated hemoglobin n=1 Tax=Streptomyces sp. NRRL B-24484 TaxID=1463833 RepID=UPI0004C0FE5A|nr:group II truncated hemoglobin [Streptomyces sp. NRRL B-24484]